MYETRSDKRGAVDFCERLPNAIIQIEAEDGVQAVVALQRMHADIDLVLLEIVMPHMDGFDVLHARNENHWIDDIPVIMVSAETDAVQVERAYGLGYAKQKRRIGMVEEQRCEKENYSTQTMLCSLLRKLECLFLERLCDREHGVFVVMVVWIKLLSDQVSDFEKPRKMVLRFPEPRGILSLINYEKYYALLGNSRKTAGQDKTVHSF